MPSESRPAPLFDPECGPLWESVRERFGHQMFVFSAETLPTMRSVSFPGREGVLAGRAYEELSIAIRGPAPNVKVSVFTPPDRDQIAPGIFWIHGGGLGLGRSFQLRRSTRRRSRGGCGGCIRGVSACT
jgi:acetyl esterase/lipase